jgi:hypothetical protein
LFSYLSLKPIIKPKIVQAGGLPAACLLANHNVTSPLAMDLQTHIAGFLVSMAERMESHLTMVASGAFEALVTLGKIQHECIQRDVVAALAHFSANGEMQVDVFPADAFMTLFDLANSEEQLTARYAIMAICNLAVVGMNQVRLCVCAGQGRDGAV